MLDIKFIRENPDLVKSGIQSKNSDPTKVDAALELDKQRRILLTEIEALRAQRNDITKETAQLGKDIKDRLKTLEPQLKEVEDDLNLTLRTIPNIPFPDVPVGKDESENKPIRIFGEPRKFDFTPKDHVELGEKLGIINIEAAGKVSGARFNYLMGDLAQMEVALVHYAFKLLTDRELIKKLAGDYHATPFKPVIPPTLITPEVYVRMARLDPGQEEERYFLQKDNLYLIGSAEHTLGPLHMDDVIDEKDLPIRYVGYSPSYRREAGSYGKDVRGILRVHQFSKVEMECFTTADNSSREQELLVAIQENIMQSLNLPYQVVSICTGDMGAPDARQFDIETWIPSQNRYRETHTSDLVTDYQSRRLNTRVRRSNGEVELVHMNDATCIAIGRTIIAILENYQNADGTITIPEVLRPLMGKDVIK